MVHRITSYNVCYTKLLRILGVSIPRGESFAHTWLNLYQHLGEANLIVLAIALVTLLTAVACKRFFPKLPGLLLGLVAGSLLAVVLA